MGSYDKVVELLVTKYGVDQGKVSAEATMADLGLDSLSVAEMLFDIEDLFGIEVSTEDAEGLKTLGDAAALADRLLEAKEG